MSKKIKKTILFNFDELEDTTIDSHINKLIELKLQFGDKFDFLSIEADYYYGIGLFGNIYETDKEYNDRMIKEEKQKELLNKERMLEKFVKRHGIDSILNILDSYKD